MRAVDIITLVRDRLGDIKKQRWSDTRLLTIISQGQIDICVETGYLRKETLLSLAIDKTIYQMPSDCYTIKRIETYDGTLIPLNSRNDKDLPKLNTSDYVGYKSNLNVRKLEIIPAPTELESTTTVVEGFKDSATFQVTPLYGVITSTDAPNMDIDPLYGAVTGIEQNPYDNLVPSDGRGEIQGLVTTEATTNFPNGNYGVVTTMEIMTSTDTYGCITAVKGHKMVGNYGIVSNIGNIKDTIKVYYVATPRKLSSILDVLLLPELWENLLMQYVVGTALQDDNDANNIQRGEYELNKYQIKLDTVKEQSANDFASSTSDRNETNFRRV